ncbi:hypothetical protein F5B22DRAFT_588839 [Xylaria bambusicola]|uniref:uncharacterized protein n=1 Tax=Xylaria bambusicola TaxID=326684 RepID=UPI002008E954|nr:uncharacterized protein F5B22DRAFT_588839 [Xylaria bambusicola]KAI0526033.1 hypothetical protein F5B22DRAFT_588839 [Xylaria bambusicola]
MVSSRCWHPWRRRSTVDVYFAFLFLLCKGFPREEVTSRFISFAVSGQERLGSGSAHDWCAALGAPCRKFNINRIKGV